MNFAEFMCLVPSSAGTHCDAASRVLPVVYCCGILLHAHVRGNQTPAIAACATTLFSTVTLAYFQALLVALPC